MLRFAADPQQQRADLRLLDGEALTVGGSDPIRFPSDSIPPSGLRDANPGGGDHSRQLSLEGSVG